MWAVSLVSGNSECGFEHNSAASCYYVTVKLTDAGLEHVSDVLAAVWAYMAMLRRIGPQRRIYDEIKDIDQVGGWLTRSGEIRRDPGDPARSGRSGAVRRYAARSGIGLVRHDFIKVST